MKVYKINACEDCRRAVYSDDNSMDFNEADKLLWDEEIKFKDSIPFKFDFCHKAYKECLLADFMYTDFLRFSVVNERTKNIIQSKYSDFVCSLPLESTDEYGNKYYSFLPIKYVELKDVLDVDKLVFSSDPFSSPFYDGIYDLHFSSIDKYCFKDIVKSYPIFRIKQSGFSKRTGKAVTICATFDIYVLDEFVQFVKDNDITGFEFKVVYDSETFNLNQETAEGTKTPVEEIKTINRRNITMENQMIPITHEDGIFSPCDLNPQTDECLEIECGGSMITNSANSYTVYNMNSCDMAKDIEVTYSGGRLESVYVNTDKGKIPVYMSFDFSLGSDPENLTKAVNECVELCAADLLSALKNAETPVEPMSLECFCDDEAYVINLQDSACNIYEVGDIADRMLCCVCTCAEQQCTYNGDYGFEVFDRILKELHKKLSEEIPKRFEVTDDFELSEPQMYD